MILKNRALLHVEPPHPTNKFSGLAEVTVSQVQCRRISAYPATVTPRGFSLIELLVVITIIAILASMLMVVFKLVQEGARGVNCLSNLRQMAMSIEVYAIDYEQKPPGGNWGQPGFPLVVGASYLAKKSDMAWSNSGRDVLKCPSDRRPQGSPGPAGRAWEGVYYRQSVWSSGLGDFVTVGTSYSANSNYFDVAGSKTGASEIGMIWDGFYATSDGLPSGFTFHKSGINMVYADGHAAFWNMPFVKPYEPWSNWGGGGGYYAWGTIYIVDNQFQPINKPPWSFPN